MIKYGFLYLFSNEIVVIANIPSLYLSLSVVSLNVSLKALGVNADGGAHPSTAAAHPKHQTGRVCESDLQTLTGGKTRREV